MEWEHKLEEYDEITRYIYAGGAIVTLNAPTTHKHFTYRITKNPDKPQYWVAVLSGPNNTRDYMYIGSIKIHMNSPMPITEFVITPGSKVTNEALSFRWFHRFFHLLTAKNIPETLEVWREHRCGKCNKPLTDPLSIKLGIGPVCRGEHKRK